MDFVHIGMLCRLKETSVKYKTLKSDNDKQALNDLLARQLVAYIGKDIFELTDAGKEIVTILENKLNSRR